MDDLQANQGNISDDNKQAADMGKGANLGASQDSSNQMFGDLDTPNTQNVANQSDEDNLDFAKVAEEDAQSEEMASSSGELFSSLSGSPGQVDDSMQQNQPTSSPQAPSVSGDLDANTGNQFGYPQQQPQPQQPEDTSFPPQPSQSGDMQFPPQPPQPEPSGDMQFPPQPPQTSQPPQPELSGDMQFPPQPPQAESSGDMQFPPQPPQAEPSGDMQFPPQPPQAEPSGDMQFPPQPPQAEPSGDMQFPPQPPQAEPSGDMQFPPQPSQPENMQFPPQPLQTPELNTGSNESTGSPSMMQESLSQNSDSPSFGFQPQDNQLPNSPEQFSQPSNVEDSGGDVNPLLIVGLAAGLIVIIAIVIIFVLLI